MSIEIERKFLVARPPVLDGLTREEIHQGYVTDTACAVEVRLRRKGGACFLAIKDGGTIERSEHEVALDDAQFDALWPTTQGRRLIKTRYTGPLPGGLLFEMDLYAPPLAPLAVVEVEFPTLEAARAFVPPDWFGAEVSGDPRYRNKTLARQASAPES